MEKEPLSLGVVTDVPKYLIDMAREVRLDISQMTQDEIIEALDKIDPCWIDEINYSKI